MTDTTRRSLPPMGAIEFAIAAVFRHFFFGLGLAIAWGLLLLPLIALVWFVALENGAPDLAKLPPAALISIAVLAAALLLASFSVAVNWHRRVLLGERPRGLHWLRLDGPVWRYLLGFVLMAVVLGVYAGAAFGVTTIAAPAMAAQMGPAAKPVAIVIAVLLGLSGLFTFYRLSSWLAALAVADTQYTLRHAWTATRRNRLAYLGFTFWLVFSLAIAGGIGAGAFFAQQMAPEAWMKGVAFSVMGLLGWFSMFLVASIAASHYAHFSGRLKNGE